MMSKWLIVEDDFNAADALAQTLVRAGCDVGIAHNAEDALSVMDSAFEGAIVDLHLPDISGDDLLIMLRKRFSGKILGIVTGEEPERIEQVAEKCNADFWMSKPIDTQALLTEISNKLEVTRCCAEMT